MMAMELVRPGTLEPDPEATRRIVAACHRAGVVVLSCGSYGNVIRLLPPLVIEDALLDDGLDVLAGAATEVLTAALRLSPGRIGAAGPVGVERFGSAGPVRQHGLGRGQTGVEQFDLVYGVAGEISDLRPVGVAGRNHRGPLDVTGRPHDLVDLGTDLRRHRTGRLHTQHLVEVDGGGMQPTAQ